MAYLLHIETSSPLCSVALSNDADLIKEVFSDGENDHAAQLAVLIKNLFFEAGVSISDLSAVSVSAGPGSYTGLRIGVSTAKGICHALNIPLIDVSTLQAMATAASSVLMTSLLCPMIDARRMEVYCALYDPLMNEIEKEDARIIDETFFQTILQIKKIAFFGSGAEKAKNFLIHENAVFLNGSFQSAKSLIPLAFHKFSTGTFANLVYFEPNYIKPFYTKP